MNTHQQAFFVGSLSHDALRSMADELDVDYEKHVSPDELRTLVLAALSAPDYGYLQHGAGTDGPFRTERVVVKHTPPDNWTTWFEGKWRKVHVQVRRTFITYRGERITIQIEGV